MEDDLHIHSAISTPYTSAPSSPGAGEPPPHSFAGGGFFYSAPTSPTHHHTLSSPSPSSISVLDGSGGSFEFEFTVRQESTAGGGPAPAGSMTSADELFLNGQIRPMKLSSHLQRPQDPPPLIEADAGGDGGDGGGGDLRSRDRSKSVRRRTRSMSPLRTNNAFQWLEDDESTEINEIKEKLEAAVEEDNENDNEAPSSSGETSRSSSAGRNSKRWVFLKELLLYRSKSEGRNSSNPNPNPNPNPSSNRNYHKLWSALSFSPNSSKKPSDSDPVSSKSSSNSDQVSSKSSSNSDPVSSKSSSNSDPVISKSSNSDSDPVVKSKKAVNGLGMNRKRREGRSAHEVHYAAKRAQAEEMRRKTYLPYRQGLLGGCLGFSSKGYGAMNGFARALNTVSSR